LAEILVVDPDEGSVEVAADVSAALDSLDDVE
jgi:hypothetical protein